MAPKTIVAKFASTCPSCSHRINVGDSVIWSRGEKAKHIACPQGAAAATTPTVDAGHVGVVDGRLSVLVQVVKALDLEPGAYGVARLHVLRSTAGHVFVWRASRERLDVGDVVTLDGTVKRHDEYRGVSQTVLTRCRVSAKHSATVFIDAQQATVVPDVRGTSAAMHRGPAAHMAQQTAEPVGESAQEPTEPTEQPMTLAEECGF